MVLTRLIVDAVTLAGCRAVVSGGWAGLGGAAPTSIYFAGPVSHAELFPHVTAIVHHGGAGTTASAARSGKPQMILPTRLYDKAFWRAQVVDRGIGIWAPEPKNLTASRFASLLHHVISDSETAQRADALGRTLRRRDAVKAAVLALERCE
jgi:sterol 3beta-glucosyltransferase